MIKKVNVVIFDFDGTLSASDSNWEFFKYCFKHSLRPWLFLPLVIFAAICACFNRNGVWWREKIRCFITPEMVANFSSKVIELHKKNRFSWAKEMVAKERAAGNKVLIISASPDYLIPDLIEDIGADAFFCSRMDKNKPYKYKFLCLGKNKVVMLDSWAKKHKYIPNVVRAYSDSKSDMPMMELALDQVWVDKKTGKFK